MEIVRLIIPTPDLSYICKELYETATCSDPYVEVDFDNKSYPERVKIFPYTGVRDVYMYIPEGWVKK